jgi:hypothetical protein
MILGEAETADNRSRGPSLTLDDVFRRHARRRPDALALIDPLNRTSFTGGSPHRVTYAEADRIVSAMAARLRDMGLPTDTVVGIQLPNIVENFMATLAVLRAGMIVAALPLLYRRTDAAAALARVGAKAIITCDRVGTFDHAQCAMNVAADVFSIRYVCGFGENLPDGVVSFADLLTADIPDPAPIEADHDRSNAAAHIAAITFDTSEGGIVPVARSHAELLAAGLAVLLEGGIAQDAVIQSTLTPSSFAGMCLALVPWLLCGGTLVLHHPFDLPTLTQQMRDDLCTALIVPDAVAFPLAATGSFAEAHPASIIAAWRAPERLATSPAWSVSGVALIDVALFGEVALVPAPGAQTAGRAQCHLARCLPRVTQPTELSLPKSAAARPAQSPCAVPWCRNTPSRPASKSPGCPYQNRRARAGRYRLHLPLRCGQKSLGRDWPASRNDPRWGLSFPAAGSAWTRRRHRSRGEAWRAAARGHRPAALRVGGRSRRHASGAACGRRQSIDRRRLRKRSDLTLQNIADWPIALTARSRVWA